MLEAESLRGRRIVETIAYGFELGRVILPIHLATGEHVLTASK